MHTTHAEYCLQARFRDSNQQQILAPTGSANVQTNHSSLPGLGQTRWGHVPQHGEHLRVQSGMDGQTADRAVRQLEVSVETYLFPLR